LGTPKLVSCRKCIECLQVRANEWGLRCHFELKENEKNCFITLTYDEEHNPKILWKPEVQKFIKRLRKSIEPNKIKYFACGEYGDQRLRPHFHIVIFGHDFEDKQFVKLSKSEKAIYYSKELETLWPYGMSTVQEANVNTVRYSAKYSMKQKKNLPEELQEFPEFNIMSQNLGIEAIMQNIETYMKTDEIWVDGFSYKIPQKILEKYFNAKFETVGERLEAIKKYKEKRGFVYKTTEELKDRKRRAEKKKQFTKLREL